MEGTIKRGIKVKESKIVVSNYTNENFIGRCNDYGKK